jgi:hypothetical protein
MSWYRNTPKTFSQTFLNLVKDVKNNKTTEVNIKRSNAQIFHGIDKIDEKEISRLMEALQHSKTVTSLNLTS